MDNQEAIQYLKAALDLIQQAIITIESGADPRDLILDAIGQLERALGDDPGF